MQLWFEALFGIDQRGVDVSNYWHFKSLLQRSVCVGLSVCRSVCHRVFYLGVQMFCSETLSSSAFSAYPACISTYKLYSQNVYLCSSLSHLEYV